MKTFKTVNSAIAYLDFTGKLTDKILKEIKTNKISNVNNEIIIVDSLGLLN